MKTFIGIAAIASVLVLTGCVAVPSYPTVQHANAAPQYTYQNSYRANHQECWREAVGPRSYTPAITGAIIGGAAGNQFGSGRGRNVATIAGAALGGSIGNDYNNRYGQQYRIVCR